MAKRKTLLVILTRLDDDTLNVWDGEMHQRATRKSYRCNQQFKSKFKLKLHVSRRIKKELKKSQPFGKILSGFHCSSIDKAIVSNVFVAQYYQKIALQDDAARQVEKSTPKPNLNCVGDKFKREGSDLLSDAGAPSLRRTCANSLLGKPALTVSNYKTRAKSDPESTSSLRKVKVSVPKEQCYVKLKPFVSDVTKVKIPLTFSTKPVETDISSCPDVNSLLVKPALASSKSKTGVKSAQENTCCRKVMVNILKATTLEPYVTNVARISPLARSTKPVEIDIPTSNSSTRAESDAKIVCCLDSAASVVQPCVRDVARVRQLTEEVAKNSVGFSTKPVEIDLRSPSANRNVNCFIKLNICVGNALSNHAGIAPPNNVKDSNVTNDDTESSSPNIKRLKSDKAVSPATRVLNSVLPRQKSPQSDKSASHLSALRTHSRDKYIICGKGGQDHYQVKTNVPLRKCNGTFQKKAVKPGAMVRDLGSLFKANFLHAVNSSGEVCAEENSSRNGEIMAAGSSEQTVAGSKSFDDSNDMRNSEELHDHPALNNGFGIELNDDISNDSSTSSVQNGIHLLPQTEAVVSKQCARTNVMNRQLWSRKGSNQNTEGAKTSADCGFRTQNEAPARSEGRNVRLNVDAVTRSPSYQNCVPQIPCIDLTNDTDSEHEDPKDVPSWSCSKCNVSFLSEEMLQQHLTRAHTTLKCYVCGQWIWGTNIGQKCMLHTHLKPPCPCCKTGFSKTAGHAKKTCSQHHFAKDAVLILTHHGGDEAPKSDCVSTSPLNTRSHGNVKDIVTKHEG